MFTAIIGKLGMGLFSKLSNIKSSILGILILCCITYAGFYVFNLNSTISTLQLEKSALDVKVAEGIKTIAIKEAKLSISESLNERLNYEIDKQNKDIKNMMVDRDKLNQDIIKLQHQEPSIKYITKTKVTTCDELNKLVIKIGGLKYEDL